MPQNIPHRAYYSVGDTIYSTSLKGDCVGEAILEA